MTEERELFIRDVINCDDQCGKCWVRTKWGKDCDDPEKEEYHQVFSKMEAEGEEAFWNKVKYHNM